MKTFSKKQNEKNYIIIPCNICGSSLYEPMWKGAEIKFVKCANCSHIYQNPQPMENELFERYDGDYFDYEIENEDTFFNLMMLGLRDIGFFEEEKACFSNSEKKKEPTFLDIGCATGRLLLEMSRRGWKTKGVEVCRSSAEYGIKRGLDIRISTLENAGFEPGYFDIIHCSHLIEHLTDPSGFVAEVFRLLSPNGRFLITTPDVSGFQAKLFGYEWRSAIDDHLQLFSFKILKRLLEDNNFSIDKKVSWGGLAKGVAPAGIKKIADRLMKRLNFGDVMCVMASAKK